MGVDQAVRPGDPVHGNLDIVHSALRNLCQS
jgi:hypothetical protein